MLTFRSFYVFNLGKRDIHIHNVLASLAVLKEFGLDFKKTFQVFKNFQPSEGRGKIHRIKRYKKNFTLIDESYNANPFSVKNALNYIGFECIMDHF